MTSPKIHLLVAIRLQSIARYRENLNTEPKFAVNLVTSIEKIHEALADKTKRSDVLVVDNGLGDVHTLVKELRQSHPRLLIVLVDEEADFGMPGRADDVSTEPFKNDELIKVIKRLFEDRRLETLRADTLPPVRQFAKSLTRAKGPAKSQAAVSAILELGYDYVAFYTITPTDPPMLTLSAQEGPSSVTSLAPNRLEYNTSLLGWVAQNGQSKIVTQEDTPNHPFISKGRYGVGVAVPVGTTLRFGVVFACKEKPGEINPKDVLMLELISTQLASALARENR
ncbi:MAG: hypothetical protein DPW16_17355 [Chloroflexi bacterium]|nr:GAF domain-containing protein [Anaerolineae bacterium]MCQ3932219.1 hypothetical protein [Chloroflexota bacterium]